MGKSHYNNIKVGKYDSMSERLVHRHYPTLKRNELSFEVWVPEWAAVKPVNAKPDFISADGKLWLEVKSPITYEKADFRIKMKLIYDYCFKNNIKYEVVLVKQGTLFSPRHYYELERLKNQYKKHEKLGATKRMEEYVQRIQEETAKNNKYLKSI